MKIPSDFITATGELHDWEAPMKTLGQIAYEVSPTRGTWARETLMFHAFWEAAAQAVRAAVIEECANVCDMQATLPECPERANYCAEAIRSLK